MSDIDFKVIIIPHKGDDIKSDFVYEPGEDYPAEKIVEDSKTGKMNYVLFHFPQKNTRDDMSNEISTLNEKIGKQNHENKKIIILPISQSCNQANDSGCKNAKNLYKLCKDTQASSKEITIDKLQSYIEYWGEKAQKESETEKKNNIMNSVLPFCIHCKNASIWISKKKDFDIYFEERKEHIKGSLIIATKILLSGKPVWENSNFKDKLETITGLVESKNNNYELKESETKAFIRQMLEMEPEKIPGFLKLLKNLKDWVDTDNVQKQQNCCR